MRARGPGFCRVLRSVTAFCPGVLGQTGMESSEVVKAICERIRADAIVTRNIRDYKGTLIPAYTPAELLRMFAEQKKQG